jgi:hypothetical protein
MPLNMDAHVGIITLPLAADHIQFIATSAAGAKGMYKQRIKTTWGHVAQRG